MNNYLEIIPVELNVIISSHLITKYKSINELREILRLLHVYDKYNLWNIINLYIPEYKEFIIDEYGTQLSRFDLLFILFNIKDRRLKNNMQISYLYVNNIYHRKLLNDEYRGLYEILKNIDLSVEDLIIEGIPLFQTIYRILKSPDEYAEYLEAVDFFKTGKLDPNFKYKRFPKMAHPEFSYLILSVPLSGQLNFEIQNIEINFNILICAYKNGRKLFRSISILIPKSVYIEILNNLRFFIYRSADQRYYDEEGDITPLIEYIRDLTYE